MFPVSELSNIRYTKFNTLSCFSKISSGVLVISQCVNVNNDQRVHNMGTQYNKQNDLVLSCKPPEVFGKHISWFWSC